VSVDSVPDGNPSYPGTRRVRPDKTPVGLGVGLWCLSTCRPRTALRGGMAPGMQDTGRRSTITLRDAVRRLPSTMSRLVFLSGLRDLNSGAYRASTASKAADADVDRVLRSMHEEAFSTWLNYRLEEQKADLDLYFSGLDCEKTAAVRTWLRLESYRSFIPASASPAERHLFLSDLEVLLYLMAHDDPGFASEVAQRAPDGPLLTAKELSRWLGVSCRALCLWAERHKMPAVKVGRQWRFSITDIREWLKARRTDRVANRLPRPAPDLYGNALQPRTPVCALRCSRTGISDLSAREQEVLMLIGQGKGNKEIAVLMVISETTVSEYRKRICRKLGLHSTGELAACAVGRLSGTCRQAAPSKNAKGRP